MTGPRGLVYDEIDGSERLFSTLASRDCKEISLAPLEVECKPQWRPMNVAPALGPISCLENSGSDAAPERLLLGQRAALFIRRVARRFRAAGRIRYNSLKTPRRISRKSGT